MTFRKLRSFSLGTDKIRNFAVWEREVVFNVKAIGKYSNYYVLKDRKCITSFKY